MCGLIDAMDMCFMMLGMERMSHRLGIQKMQELASGNFSGLTVGEFHLWYFQKLET